MDTRRSLCGGHPVSFSQYASAIRPVVQEIKAVKAIIYAPQYIRLISCDIAPYPTYLAKSAELTEYILRPVAMNWCRRNDDINLRLQTLVG